VLEGIGRTRIVRRVYVTTLHGGRSTLDLACRRSLTRIVSHARETDTPGNTRLPSRPLPRATLAYPVDLINALRTFLDDPPSDAESWIWWL
ncbi:MAG: hypothetical protein QNL12_15905, partial [Acidimicrobiia bacterium]|nr:hypothetical protein [Acidimicrobiia bacterium]